MEMNEQQILGKVFWPEDKAAITGNMSYNMTHDDLTSTVEVNVSRTNDVLEIYYGTGNLFNPAEKMFLVQMIFDRQGDNLVLNKEKTSPTLKDESDVLEALEQVQNSVQIMKASSVKPLFFSTGVINTPASRLTL